MNKELIGEKILKLSDTYYFENTKDSQFLCEYGMDLGVDLTKEGVVLYYDKPITIKYDEPSLLSQIKKYLKDYK